MRKRHVGPSGRLRAVAIAMSVAVAAFGGAAQSALGVDPVDDQQFDGRLHTLIMEPTNTATADYEALERLDEKRRQGDTFSRLVLAELYVLRARNRTVTPLIFAKTKLGGNRLGFKQGDVSRWAQGGSTPSRYVEVSQVPGPRASENMSFFWRGQPPSAKDPECTQFVPDMFEHNAFVLTSVPTIVGGPPYPPYGGSSCGVPDRGEHYSCAGAAELDEDRSVQGGVENVESKKTGPMWSIRTICPGGPAELVDGTVKFVYELDFARGLSISNVRPFTGQAFNGLDPGFNWWDQLVPAPQSPVADARDELLRGPYRELRRWLNEQFVPSRSEAMFGRVSVDPNNGQFTGASQAAVPSADGRYVVFATFGDGGSTPNATTNVYLRDRKDRTTQLILAGSSDQPTISANGSMIAYRRSGRVYARPRVGTTPTNVAAGHSPALNADGRYLAYVTSTGGIILRDLQTGTNRTASKALTGSANGVSSAPSVSDDGRYVAFASAASNLVSGDSDGRTDIFIYDRVANSVTLVSRSSSASQSAGADSGPSISGDGSTVVWRTTAEATSLDANPAGVWARRISTGATSRVSVLPDGALVSGTLPSRAAVSRDGQSVVFLGVGHLASHVVYRRDLTTSSTARVWPIRSLGDPSLPWGASIVDLALSADGQTTVFSTNSAAVVANDTNGRADVFANGQLDPTPTTLTTQGLLEKHVPELRYQRREPFLATSAATATDNGVIPSYSNELRRRDPSDEEQSILLKKGDPSESASTRLSLDFLGGVTYAQPVTPEDGAAVNDQFDFIDLQRNDTRALDFKRMYGDGTGPYGHQTYGRVVHHPSGKTALQYWFFYYHNPKTFAFTGDHEGDWEQVQIDLDVNGQPEQVTRSAHGGGARCDWNGIVRTATGRPVIYVAFQSHANYFRPGSHSVFDLAPAELMWDYAEGDGFAGVPRVVDVTVPPAWMYWPGFWGGSSGTFGSQGQSPRGPMQHANEWSDPVGWSSDASVNCDSSDPIPATPPPPRRVTAQQVGDTVQVNFGFDPIDLLSSPAPDGVVVAASGTRLVGLTPTFEVTERFELVLSNGQVTLPLDSGMTVTGVEIRSTSASGAMSAWQPATLS